VDAGPAVGVGWVGAAAVAAEVAAAAAHAGDGAAGAELDDPADTIKLDELPCGHLRPAHDLLRLCLLRLAQAAVELEKRSKCSGRFRCRCRRSR